jgi:hypothetical protein
LDSAPLPPSVSYLYFTLLYFTLLYFTSPYLTLSRQASTLLPRSFTPSRRRRAALRLVSIVFFPLSLFFFFFASALLFTVHAPASRSVLSLVVLCRIASSLPPTCSSRRLLSFQSENWVGLLLGHHANTKTYSIPPFPRPIPHLTVCRIIHLALPIDPQNSRCPLLSSPTLSRC